MERLQIPKILYSSSKLKDLLLRTERLKPRRISWINNWRKELVIRWKMIMMKIWIWIIHIQIYTNSSINQLRKNPLIIVLVLHLLNSSKSLTNKLQRTIRHYLRECLTKKYSRRFSKEWGKRSLVILKSRSNNKHRKYMNKAVWRWR